MSLSATQALNSAVEETLGAAFVGFALSCVVFGVLTMLTYSYFQHYYSDRPFYKILVAAIWILELVDQAFIGHSVYFYAITNFARPFVLLTGDVIWSLILQLILGVRISPVGRVTILNFLVAGHGRNDGQMLLCSSRLEIERNIYVAGLVILLTFGQFGLAIFYAIRAFELKKLVFASELTEFATLSLGAGVLTDFIIAVTLCYYLRKLRTGYTESDSLVSTLTIYTINTGVITSAISLTTLILYNVYPTKFLFMGTYFVLSKFYAISFICTLNTRRIVRGRGTDKAAPSGLTGLSDPTILHVHGQTFNMLSPTFLELSYDSSVVVHHGHHRDHERQSCRHSLQTQSMTMFSKRGLEIGIHKEVSVISESITEVESSRSMHSSRGATSTKSLIRSPTGEKPYGYF
ncbi:hypothetical protein BDN72DRAFT_898468 [Pluteus cervinus]|uniref:Uncharacterized protein n=1 Tax=Pluteus cervinus TaxID=181527 RepID=A0ACD3ASY9_9AGAR|nr:hypothetical protein BDN72DRAFT_898468 [Pluteus cervinus]